MLARCIYIMTLVAPNSLANVIDVPLRICAIEGAPSANHTVVPASQVYDVGPDSSHTGEYRTGFTTGTTGTDQTLLSLMNQVNTGLLADGAGVIFTLEPIAHIPIIADPDNGTAEDPAVGEVNTSDGEGQEPDLAFVSCNEAWSSPTAMGGGNTSSGLELVFAKDFGINSEPQGQTFGATIASDPIDNGLDNPRRADYCTAPRQLLPDDVGPDGYGSLLQDPSVLQRPAADVAHELGHQLTLQHGNGLDDNHNAVPPPAAGNRWFDDCDPLGNGLANDAPEDVGGTSLMSEVVGSLSELTNYQIERLRDAAMVVPGNRVLSNPSHLVFATSIIAQSKTLLATCPTCAATRTIFQINATRASDGNVTEFSMKLGGAPDVNTGDPYSVLIDSDNNQSTGCNTSPFGLGTTAPGIEVVAVMEPQFGEGGGSQTYTPEEYRCTKGAFVLQKNPLISGVTAPNVRSDASGSATGGGSITLRVPNSLLGSFGSMRIQAIAGDAADRQSLPSDPTTTALLVPDRTSTPVCSTSVTTVRIGQKFNIKAASLPPNQAIGITSGPGNLGTSASNADGQVSATEVFSPGDQTGSQWISVKAVGSATAASCPIELLDAPVMTPHVGPFVSVANASIVAGSALDRQMVFAVTMSQPLTTPVVVNYVLDGLTAAAGQDFNEPRHGVGKLVIPPSATTKYVVIPIHANPKVEPDTGFQLTLTNASSGVTLGAPAAIGTIFGHGATNADGPPSLGVGDAAVWTSQSGRSNSMKVPVTLSSPSSAAVDATVTISDATTSQVVFVRKLMFTPGQTERYASVPVASSTVPADDRTLSLDMATSTSGITMSRSHGVGLILSST